MKIDHIIKGLLKELSNIKKKKKKKKLNEG